MQSFAEIVEKIKDIKGLENDYEVADILDIKPKTLAADKTRNSIPFDELTTFCNREGISLNWLLTNKGPKNLEIKLTEQIKYPRSILNNRIVNDSSSLYILNNYTISEEQHSDLIDRISGGDRELLLACLVLKKIFDDKIHKKAICDNLRAFELSINDRKDKEEANKKLQETIKENEEVKKRISNLEKLCKEIPNLKNQFETLQKENKSLKKENRKLRELNGNSAPTKLGLDNAALTGTEDNET